MNKLLRFTPVIAIAAVTFITACDKIIELKADINGGSITFNLDPQAKGSYEDQQNITIDIQSELEKNNVDINKLKKLYLKSATFTIVDTTASPVTFDIANSATLEIGSTVAMLPMTKLAWKDPIPNTGASIIDADVDGSVDLLPFAKAGNVQYRVYGTLNGDLDHAVDIKAELKWTIEF